MLSLLITFGAATTRYYEPPSWISDVLPRHLLNAHSQQITACFARVSAT